MVSRLLLGLFAGLCLLELSEGARFDGFEDCYGYVTCVDGHDIPCPECSVNSTSSTVRRTVVTETGAILHLGTCYGRYYCTAPYNSSDLQVRNDGYISNVQFYNNSSRFSGEVTCEETRTNGSVLVDTCHLKVVRLYSGNVQPYNVRENDAITFRCYNSPYTPSTVRWSLTKTSGQTLDLGTCSHVGNCTSPHAPDITVQRPYNYKSQVNFQNIDRSKGGELFCSYTYNGMTETDNVTLNVYNVSQLHTTWDQFYWTAVGLGGALGLVFIILIVVIIVLYRRGRLCRSPTPNASQDNLMNLSDFTKNKRNGAKQGLSCSLAVYQGDGDTAYENAAMGGTGRSHMIPSPKQNQRHRVREMEKKNNRATL